MKFGFSASTKGFYLLARKEAYILNHNWPDDIKPVSDEIFYHYSGETPEGKVLGSDDQGFPRWVDAPLPTDSERLQAFLSEKTSKINEAIEEIRKLEIIQSVTALNAADESALSAWRAYLSHIYIMTGLDKSGLWPDKPEQG